MAGVEIVRHQCCDQMLREGDISWHSKIFFARVDNEDQGIVSGCIANKEGFEPPLCWFVRHVHSEMAPALEGGHALVETNGTIGVESLRDTWGQQIHEPLDLLKWLVAGLASRYELLNVGKMEKRRNHLILIYIGASRLQTSCR